MNQHTQKSKLDLASYFCSFGSGPERAAVLGRLCIFSVVDAASERFRSSFPISCLAAALDRKQISRPRLGFGIKGKKGSSGQGLACASWRQERSIPLSLCAALTLDHSLAVEAKTKWIEADTARRARHVVGRTFQDYFGRGL